MSLTDVSLRDEFGDTRAAGAVNGTLATDGVNTRYVVDTTNLVTIQSGELRQNGLAVSTSDPSFYESAITRTVGAVMSMDVMKLSAYGGSENPAFGLYAATNSSWSSIHAGGYISGGFNWIYNSGNAVAITNTITDDVYYNYKFALRSSGGFVFIDGKLGWIFTSGNTATLYPRIANIGARQGWKTRRWRYAGYWLPTPLISDGFGSSFGTSDGLGHAETSGVGSGGAGVTWTGATWSVSGGKAINTPTGSEQLSGGDLEGTYTGGLNTLFTSTSGTPTVSQSADAHGGTKAQSFTSNGASDYIQLTPSDTIGQWKLVSAWGKQVSVGNSRVGISKSDGANSMLVGTILSGTYTRYVRTYRALTSANNYLRVYAVVSGSDTVVVDDISLQNLTLSQLISLHTSSTADVFAGIDLVVTAGTQAGLALNWDSSSSPANGVVAYHDGTNCKLEKCVAGVWTTVLSVASTYSAGMRLIVSKIGTAYRVYTITGGTATLVGSATISDAGIVSNTKHGLFSTDSSNTLDNYTCYASGTGGEYASAFDIAIPASGASAGTAGTDANATRKRTANGASAGIGDATGATSVHRNVVGQSNGASEASGTGLATRLASGQSVGDGTATGATSVQRNVAGQSNGNGSATATSSRKRLAAGVSAGNGTATIHNHTVSATISS